MSKSKGNGVDPMDLIEKYGADAMRFNLLTLVTNNQDVKFDANIDKKTHELIDSPRTEAARSFVTKIWNAARFVMMNMEGYEPGEPEAATPADAWILSRLAKLTANVTSGIEEYRFGDRRPRAVRLFLERVLRLVHRAQQGPPQRGRSRPRRRAAQPRVRARHSACACCTRSCRS